MAYPNEIFIRVESLPPHHIGTFLLEYPSILVALAYLSFDVTSDQLHIAVHSVYLALFLLFGKIRNTTLYRKEYIKHAFFVPLFHAGILAYAAYVQDRAFFYIADFWLAAYWIAHEKVICIVNIRALELD